MKPRVLILPISAVIIIGMVTWRLNRDADVSLIVRTTVDERRLAPRFELYDQHSQFVKFERYLGRTRLLVVFIADASADKHPLVRQLCENHDAIEDAGVQVVVVGTATPFATREAEKRRGDPFPFPVLSDVNLQTPEPTPTHRQWGLADDDPTDVQQGLFLIARDGTVAWSDSTPQPVIAPPATITKLTSGD